MCLCYNIFYSTKLPNNNNNRESNFYYFVVWFCCHPFAISREQYFFLVAIFQLMQLVGKKNTTKMHKYSTKFDDEFFLLFSRLVSWKRYTQFLLAIKKVFDACDTNQIPKKKA